MAQRRIVIPARFIRVDSGRGTFSLRSTHTGKFRGRTKGMSGRGDFTSPARIKSGQYADIDGDGVKDPLGGLIIGRSFRGSSPRGGWAIRASSRAKGHVRRI